MEAKFNTGGIWTRAADWSTRKCTWQLRTLRLNDNVGRWWRVNCGFCLKMDMERVLLWDQPGHSTCEHGDVPVHMYLSVHYEKYSWLRPHPPANSSLILIYTLRFVTVSRRSQGCSDGWQSFCSTNKDRVFLSLIISCHQLSTKEE